MNDHRHSLPEEVLSFGPFSLFVTGRQLKRADEPIPLGGRALDLLIALAERAGEVVSYNELVSSAWPNVTVYDGNLRVQIAALRKALNDGEDGARYISNVAGRGYCFVAPVSHSATRPTTAERNADGELPRKLPLPLARMVGRDEVVRAVSEQLIIGRFVSIVGPGGIGKTTVAISVAHSLLNGFHGAVFFIDLGTLTNPQLVPTAVGSALGFMVQAHDPFGSLVAFLDDKKILLILDNCEHVIGSVSELAERVVNEAASRLLLAVAGSTFAKDSLNVLRRFADLKPIGEPREKTLEEFLAYRIELLPGERNYAPNDRTPPELLRLPRIAMELMWPTDIHSQDVPPCAIMRWITAHGDIRTLTFGSGRARRGHHRHRSDGVIYDRYDALDIYPDARIPGADRDPRCTDRYRQDAKMTRPILT